MIVTDAMVEAAWNELIITYDMRAALIAALSVSDCAAVVDEIRDCVAKIEEIHQRTTAHAAALRDIVSQGN